MRISVRAYPLVAFGLVAALAACGDSATSPNVPAQIHLTAPSEMEPGGSFQLRLILAQGTRATDDVTSRAQWKSSNPAVVTIGSTGMANALKSGDTTITGTFEARSATMHVLVLPKGTFRVDGTIQESRQGIEGVTLTVLSGDGTGETATSALNGAYSLFGLRGRVRIGLSKPGFRDATYEIDVTGHMRQDFEMALDGPASAFNGRYSLTISAAGGCSQGFPSSATTRTYAADLRQEGSYIQVTLRDGQFIPHGFGYGDRFWGWTFGGRVYLYVGDDYYYSTPDTYGIAERFGSETVLVKGTISVSGTADRVEGTIFGRLAVGSTQTAPFKPITGECPNPRFELRRQ